MQAFAERLEAVVDARGALCVGIDAHPASLAKWGLADDAAGLEAFSRGLVEALAGRVAVFKPQSAFFEAQGPAGLSALSRTLRDVAAAGALSILDVKRGDIGSTMAAYARAYLADGAELAADAITVSPFLGFEALQPAVDLAAATGRGLFALARTSNPEGAEVQLAVSPDAGGTVAQHVVAGAAAANRRAGTPLVGLVIGATLAKLDVDLDGFDGWILAPGIGAQGAEMTHLAELFGARPARVLPTVSRSIADVGPAAPALRDAVARAVAGWNAGYAG